MVRITEKETSDILSSDAHVLVTQKEANKTGDVVESLRRVPRDVLFKDIEKKIDSLYDEKVSITDITLGLHTDGLIYIFVGGKPVGNGLTISGGTVEDAAKDDITVVEGAMTILALENNPTQTDTTLMIA